MQIDIIFGEEGETLYYDSNNSHADPYSFILTDRTGETHHFCEEELENLSKAITKVLEIYNA